MADGENLRDRFLKAMGESPSNQQAPTNSDSNSGAGLKSRFLGAMGEMLPMSAQAAGVNAPPSSVTASPSLNAQEREGRIGPNGERIPIDFSEGLSLGDYSRVAAQRDPEAQLQLLQKMYPNRKARQLESGEITLEVIDSKTGKPKDVMLNPAGMDAHDLIDLAVQAPEIAAGVAYAVATKGRGLLKTAAQIIGSSLASGVTGGARDAVARGVEGLPIRPEEIGRTRATGMAVDMFSQSSLGILGKSLRALSPFATDIKPGTLAFDLQAGRQFIKDNFGVELKPTPSQVTGSSALAAVEAAESKQPGARTVFGRMKDENDAKIQDVIRRAIGEVPSEESLGAQSVDLLKQKVVLPIEESLKAAREAAETKGNERVKKLIDDAIGVSSPSRVTPTTAGEMGLAEFEQRLAQAKSKVDEAYSKVNALPGGSGDVLSGDVAAEAAAAIRKELPQVQSGGKSKVLGSGVPEGVMKALDDLESLRGGKVSLQTLTNMKRAAYDEIAKTEAVPGVKERWFNKIASAYEEGIQKGIEDTGDPALKAALTNAKETYKRELLPFDRPGVKEMARGEYDAGRLAPEQVVNRLFEGPKAIENYRMLKDVLGENSPALRTMKRAWADSKIAEVSDPILGTIDAGKLYRSFEQMQVDKPELAAEIFGKNYKDLMGALRSLRGTQSIASNLDERELKAVLATKDPTATDLRNIVRMTQERDKTYVNTILKDIADGMPVSNGIKPTEFFQRITNAKTPSADVESILSTIQKENPELRESLATLQFYKLLDAATVNEAKSSAKAIAGEQLNISAKKLADAIGDPASDQGKRIRAILGEGKVNTGTPPVIGSQSPTRLEIIENLAKVLQYDEAASSAFRSAGSIAQGQAVLEATRSPLKYASNFAKKMFLSIAYTSDIGQKLVANRVFAPEETAAIANTLIASEPFARRAVETMGSETAKAFIGSLKNSIDLFMNEAIRDTPQKREQAEMEKLTSGKPSKTAVR